ncbi:MAG: hypothetical protein JW807_00670 [Spirochaetes bacterium]|nr:hypothetical protein [Spirochaetota bacterium]
MSKSAPALIIIAIVLIMAAPRICSAWELVANGYLRETFDDNINATVEVPINPYLFASNPAMIFFTRQERILWDFISEVMASLGVHHEGKTQVLDIQGRFRSQVYGKNFKEMTNYSEDAALFYTMALSDLATLHVIDNFQHYPEPDRYEREFGITEGRLSYYGNTITIGGTFTITPHYAFTLEYVNQYFKNEYRVNWRSRAIEYANYNLIERPVDSSIMHAARTQQEMHWDSHNYSFLFYEYTWMQHYPGGVSQTHTPGAGHRLNFTSQLYAEVRVAPEFLLPYHDPLGGVNILQSILAPWQYLYISLYTQASLVNEVDRKTVASLIFTYRTSIRDNSIDIFSNWQISGDFTRHIFSRLVLSASIFYGQGFYITRRETNRFFGLAPSVAYEFNEHLSGRIWYELSVNYTRVDGLRLSRGYVFNSRGYAVAFSGYTRNQLSIGITAEL